ncbi:restriction endonuclease subunit S [Aeromonas veronii]|uniref:restriction endonuclease subunit S n=1 Tax=Aeromonas veronii TaxID=654 RepID=UPI00313CD482
MSEVVTTSQQGLAGKYKPYPEYKDSGVEWLGDIPTHWSTTVLKRLCCLTTGLTPPTSDETNYAEDGYPWVRPEDINESGSETNASKFVSNDGWQLLRKIEPNSTLICCIGTIGKCGYVRKTVSTNQQITAATFSKSGRYNYYLLQAARTQLEELATGNVLKILNTERLGALNLVKVPVEEADTIAAFIDYETARIDRLIAQQQRLIELLKEKRQAVISHAVTKGLNPDVPMKDSGVEWIGQVPEHWEALPIKYVSWFVGTGGTPKDRDSFTDENEINWFTPGDFNGELVLDDSGKYVTKGSILSGDAKIYPAESVLIVGIGATLGKVGVCNFKFSCNQQINIVTPNRKIAVDFLAFSLLAQTEQMKQTSNASTIGIMNQEKTKGIQIAVPPVQEQTSLIIHLKKKLSDFSLTTSKAEQLIALLQERRSALISAAVTGKIDLRGWTPPAEEVAA